MPDPRTFSMELPGQGAVLVFDARSADATGDPVVAERTYVFADDSFEPMAHKQGGAWIHYLNDHEGTPLWLLHGDGSRAGEISRSAWGRFADDGRADADTPLRLQGQYADEETGLHYNRWRYYDPDAGRFLSTDPIGLAGSSVRAGISSRCWQPSAAVVTRHANNAERTDMAILLIAGLATSMPSLAREERADIRVALEERPLRDFFSP